jgi:hypothetical protein
VSDYEELEAAEEKRRKRQAQKVSAVDRLPGHKFTSVDEACVANALKVHGNSYSKIQKQHYPHLKPKDIQNYVMRTESLKEIAEQVHENVRDERKRKFDEVLQNSLVQTSKTKKTKSEAGHVTIQEDERSDFPIEKENGMVLTPQHFLTPLPFIVEREDKYVYFIRTHLAQLVDIDVNDEKDHLIFTFETENKLLPEELKQTKLFESDKNLQVVSDQSMNACCVIPIPEDAAIEEIDRFGHDTPAGALVEVWLPKKKKVNLKDKLKAPRFKNINSTIQTTQKLAHPTEEEE